MVDIAEVALGAGATFNSATAASSITPAKPANLADGMVVLLGIATNNGSYAGGSQAKNTDGLWDRLCTLQDNATANVGLTIFRRVIPTAASEPSTYGFSFVQSNDDTTSQSVTYGGIFKGFSSVDNITPEDVAAVILATTSAGSATTAVPAVTSVTDRAMVVAFAACDLTSAASWSAPAGYTDLDALSAGRAIAAAILGPVTPAGTSPQVNFNNTGGAPGVGAQIALRPTGGGGGGGGLTGTKAFATAMSVTYAFAGGAFQEDPGDDPSLYSDDFATFDAGVWDTTGSGTVTADGVLHVKPATGAANSEYVNFLTMLYLSDNSVFIHVVQPVSGSQNGYFMWQRAPNWGIRFKQNASTIYFETNLGGVFTDIASIAWSTSDSWWRFREASGTVYWDTGPDGSTWTQRASWVATIDLKQSQLRIGNESYASVATPVEFQVNQFNAVSAATDVTGLADVVIAAADVLAPRVSGGHPSIDGLTDNFLTADSAKWQTLSNTGVAVAGGQLQLTAPSAAGAATAAAVSTNLWSLRDTTASVELIQANAPVAGSQTAFYLGDAWSQNFSVWFVIDNTTLSFQYVNGDGNFVNAGTAITYDPVAHKWWRFREVGGTTVYWETSPDAVTWTQRASWAHAFDLDNVGVALEANTWQAVASPGTVIFDNFNLSAFADTVLATVAAATGAALGSTQAAQRQPAELPPVAAIAAAAASPTLNLDVSFVAFLVTATAAALASTQATVRQPTELPPVATAVADVLASIQAAQRNVTDLPPVTTAAASVGVPALLLDVTNVAVLATGQADAPIPLVGIVSLVIAAVSAVSADALASTQATVRQVADLPPAATASAAALSSTQAAQRQATDLPPVSGAVADALPSVQSGQRQVTDLPPAATGQTAALASTQTSNQSATELPPVADAAVAALASTQAAQRNATELPPVTPVTFAALASVQLAIRVVTDLPPAATATADVKASTQTSNQSALELPPTVDAAASALASTQAAQRNDVILATVTGALANALASIQAAIRQVTDVPPVATVGGQVGIPTISNASTTTVVAEVSAAVVNVLASVQAAQRQPTELPPAAQASADGLSATIAAIRSALENATVAQGSAGAYAAAITATGDVQVVAFTADAAAVAPSAILTTVENVAIQAAISALAADALAADAAPIRNLAIDVPLLDVSTGVLTPGVGAEQVATISAELAELVADAGIPGLSTDFQVVILAMPAEAGADTPIVVVIVSGGHPSFDVHQSTRATGGRPTTAAGNRPTRAIIVVGPTSARTAPGVTTARR